MISKPAVCRRAKVNDYYASPAETEKISVLPHISECQVFASLNFLQFRCHIFSSPAFDVYGLLKKLITDIRLTVKAQFMGSERGTFSNTHIDAAFIAWVNGCL